MIIPEIIVVLSLCLGLGVRDYKAREQATHELKDSTISYDQLKFVYHHVEDPEVKERVKNLAWLKWCIATDGKYRDADYYGEEATLNNKLQKEHFDIDFIKK